MGNPIKFSATSSTKSLRIGNASIGVQETSYGPTVTTGFWNGLDVPPGYYIIYQETSEPTLSTFGNTAAAPYNDSELINYVINSGGTGISTVADALEWIAGQPNLVCITSNLARVIAEDLALFVDAGYAPSYPRKANTWYDLSGNSINLTLVNSPTFSNNSFFEFNGSTNYAVGAGSNPGLAITSQITLSAWINPSNVTGTKTIVGRGSSGVFSLSLNGANVQYGLDTGSGVQTGTGSVALTANKWYLVGFTYDGGTVNIYVNGELDSTFSQTGTIQTSVNDIYIGYSGSGLDYFNGDISKVLIYSQSLSPEEMLANFTATVPETADLLLNLDPTNPASGNLGTAAPYNLVNGDQYAYVNGTTWSPTAGGSFSLDGTNDSIFGNPITVASGNPWTMSFWVLNPTLLDSGDVETIFGGPNTSTPGWIYQEISATISVFDIEIDSSGDIYVGGAFTLYKDTKVYSIIKLKPDGSVDTTFDVGIGFGFSGNQNQASVQDIEISSTGKIYVCGDFNTYKGISCPRGIIRLNTDGSVDNTFNAGAGFNSSAFSVREDSNGDIYVGGYFSAFKGVSNNNKIIKIDSAGSKITAFNNATGFRFGTDTSTSFGVTSIALSPDQTQIYCGGTFTTYKTVSTVRMARLNTSDGSLDNTFDMSVGFDSTVSFIAPVSTGEIYVGGAFLNALGVSANRIFKLNNNGTQDTSFVFGTGFSSTVDAIKIDPSTNKIYIGGNFTTYNGSTAGRIIRLNTNGTVDTAFSTSSGFNSSTIYNIEIDSNGDLYVGGTFQSYKGVNNSRIIKILSSNAAKDSSFVNTGGFSRGYYRYRLRFYYTNSAGVIS